MLRATFVTAILTAVLSTFSVEAAIAGPGEAQQQAVDRLSSSVDFTVSAKAIVSLKRDGTFHDFSGSLAYDPADPSMTRVDLTVYTASVDLHSHDQEDLLRSEQFFDVDRHPTLHFVSTAATPRADGGLDVAGDLTIRGITKHLVVPMNVLKKLAADGRTALETRFQIDRTEFGLTGAGAKASGFNVSIGKNVSIHLSLAASPSASKP